MLVYDGEFEGLLCAVAHCLDEGEEPDDFLPRGSAAQTSLFAEEVTVETDPARVDEMCARIRGHISAGALRRCLYAFLSEEKGREMHIFRYLRLAFIHGREVDAHLRHASVRAVRDMGRRTAHEAHRIRGFLRFRGLRNGLYYAPMQAKCDVLRLVAPYFQRRMGDQDWVIHDLARERAALCRRGELAFFAAPGFEPDLSQSELRAQKLWRDYFEVIAVAERLNPRLQRNLMPERYRRTLIEEPRGSRPASHRDR